ncbi:MAG: hypothetical protein HYX40_04155 [Sphingobacteriales bacterium]|nr:hypothetical protein [Sphingobacteriales bacterium]
MGYDKLKDKKLSNPQKVFFVGAFDNMHGEAAAKTAHLKNGFISKYGKEYVSVLLDADGILGKLTSSDGLTVIILKKNSNQPIITSFGTKRKSFFDAINKYFN